VSVVDFVQGASVPTMDGELSVVLQRGIQEVEHKVIVPPNGGATFLEPARDPNENQSPLTSGGALPSRCAVRRRLGSRAGLSRSSARTAISHADSISIWSPTPWTSSAHSDACDHQRQRLSASGSRQCSIGPNG